MPVLVHITKAESENSIRRSGIKVGNHNSVVYFMPHMKEFLISHQWARELKRSGIKNFIAVDFKVPKDETIWFGKYSEGHESFPLNKAIEKFMSLEDKLGIEFFIERKIEPKEIIKIREITKPMGWRYEPSSHGKKPCPCPMCIQKGGYKTKNISEKYETISREKARVILRESEDDDELLEALERMKGKWRKESPEYLERLLTSKDEYVLYALVELLAEHRHPLAKDYLKILAESDDADASELALECLERI